MRYPWATKRLPKEPYDLAADGSAVRLLLAIRRRGSAVHCTLPMKAVSFSTTNIGIDEIWYFLEGKGQLWRKQAKVSQTIDVSPGVSITIPAGTVFQFRNTGRKPLVFLCITMPPWKEGTNKVVEQQRWPVCDRG